jgi:MoaE-MoaD fusion protein
MRVRVLFFGILKDIVGRSEESLEIAANSTLASLFDACSVRFETLRDKRPSILFARNREFATPDTPLAEDDEIAFLPPVSGGTETAICTPEGHLFAITREGIDSQELAHRLRRPEDGAVVIFEGVVRNNANGRPVSHLEYECYEQMALKQISRIGTEIAAQFSLGRIGMIHRLGSLQVGEVSVSVVAVAPHRRAAFEGALEGINRLKREVPIWKKEYFADGAVWVEGEWDQALLAGSPKDESR